MSALPDAPSSEMRKRERARLEEEARLAQLRLQAFDEAEAQHTDKKRKL